MLTNLYFIQLGLLLQINEYAYAEFWRKNSDQ